VAVVSIVLGTINICKIIGGSNTEIAGRSIPEHLEGLTIDGTTTGATISRLASEHRGGW